MKNVYVLELYFSGDICVFETAEMARGFAIQKIREYCIKDYETAINEINMHYEKYNGEFDTKYANSTKALFIMKGRFENGYIK